MEKTTLSYIVFAAILFISSTLFAQNAPIDFEDGGYGADWTWTVFENDTNPPVEILANPDASDPNTSATVAKFTALEAGQPWAGCESLHGSDIGTFTLDETNSTIKIMVHKPVISDVGIKLVKPDGWSMGEIKVANTVINQWEELTFDFSAHTSDGYDQIVIFPDFNLDGRTQDNICYFDNITFHPQESVEGPNEPAPTPSAPDADVISLFSNAYTNVAVDTWSAEWDQADVSDIQIEGNDTKLYTNLVFAGIEFISQTIDASDMTHFHLDLWTPDNTSDPAVFMVKLVDFGADGAWGGDDDVEHELTFDENTMDSETWVSLDIPMSDFVNLTTTGHLAQLILSGDPNTIYLDNIYFYNNSNSADENINDPNLSNYALKGNYPNPFNPITTINFSISQPGFVSLKIFDVKGRLIDTLVNEEKHQGNYEINWNAKDTASGVYFYRLNVNNKTIDTKRMLLLK